MEIKRRDLTFHVSESCTKLSEKIRNGKLRHSFLSLSYFFYIRCTSMQKCTNNLCEHKGLISDCFLCFDYILLYITRYKIWKEIYTYMVISDTKFWLWAPQPHLLSRCFVYEGQPIRRTLALKQRSESGLFQTIDKLMFCTKAHNKIHRDYFKTVNYGNKLSSILSCPVIIKTWPYMLYYQ